MQILLNRVEANNFKGLKHFIFEPNGDNAVIRGPNASGKTSVMESVLWVFFGKDSHGKTDFALKPLNEDGEELHNLDCSVEVSLNVDEGHGVERYDITLKKTLKEKYTKKRGSPKATLTGHTTDHSINGVPVKKKEWDERISGLIDEETFKLLTTSTYFNSITWPRMREILLQVCGDISNEDVISSQEALSKLPDVLKDRSIDEHRKVISRQKTAVNDRLKEIPARIDELSKSLPEFVGLKKDIELKISEIQKDIQDIKDDTVLAGKRKHKAELESKLVEEQAFFETKRRNLLKKTDDKILEVERKISEALQSIQGLTANINENERYIQINLDKMDDLRKEFNDMAKEQYRGDNICKACGQDLPEDQVEKAMENFNRAQAATLTDIDTAGKDFKAKNDVLKEQNDRLENQRNEINEALGKLNAEDEELKTNRPELPEPPLIKELQEKIGQLHHDIKSGEKTLNTADLEEELKAEQTKLAEIDAAKKTKERIKELGEEEKALAAEFEEIQAQLYLIETFETTKAEMLEDKIAEKFKLARFKLFKRLINEGIEPMCETTYLGVPWRSLNTGARTNVGLDIVKTLSEFYNTSCPIFIDHAEAVTDILDIGTQTIKLYVDDKCEEMEVNVG